MKDMSIMAKRLHGFDSILFCKYFISVNENINLLHAQTFIAERKKITFCSVEKIKFKCQVKKKELILKIIL